MIGSTQQLAEVLFVKLGLSRKRRGKTGFSTDARVLQAIRGEHEIVPKIERYRELTKLAQTYLDALPILCDYFMVYYNKELFAKKGVAFPKTMDEMMVAAGKLHDPAGGVAGFVGRGVRNANVVLWTQLLAGWGAARLRWGAPPRGRSVPSRLPLLRIASMPG